MSAPHQMLHGRRQLVLLRCLVNSVNERNPLLNLLISNFNIEKYYLNTAV